MKKIAVKKTTKGSPDGLTVNTYEEGKTYDMPDSLAKVFVTEKWGKIVKQKATVKTPEDAVVDTITPEGIAKDK